MTRTVPRRPLALRLISFPGLAAALLLAAFLAVALVHVSRPGLEYDETLFVNAATGGHGGSFVYRRLFGVPVLLMSYIGALKAYIFYPIFHVFGVSALTIRLPAVLLAAVALLVTYLLARALFAARLALLVMLLVGSEPAFIFTSKGDWGPTVLMTLLKMSALYGLFRFLQDGRLRHLLLLEAALLLGTFDKLNFLWFAGALLVAAPLALWPELRARAAELRSPGVVLSTAVCALLGLTMVAAFLPTALHDTNSGPLNLGAHLSALATLFRTTFDGSAVFSWMTGRQPSFVGWTPLLVVPAALGTAAGAASRVSPWPRNPEAARDLRVALFFGVLSAAMFAAMVVTRSAGGPHHVFMLWALPGFSTVAAVRGMLRALQPRLRAACAVAPALALAGALVASQAVVDAEFVDAFGGAHAFAMPWTPAVYPLSQALEQRLSSGDGEVVLADWGMGNQLYGLAARAHRADYLDDWPLFLSLDTTSAQACANVRTAFFAGRHVLVVLHTPGQTAFQAARAHFFAMAARTGLPLGRPLLIDDPAGRAVFEVYEVAAG